MKRNGAIPERTHSTRSPVDFKKANKLHGRRFRIKDVCWARGLCQNDKHLWVNMETEVDAGATGTIDAGDEFLYKLYWDATADLRLGYTTIDQKTLNRLLKSKVLEEIRCSRNRYQDRDPDVSGHRQTGFLTGKRIRHLPFRDDDPTMQAQGEFPHSLVAQDDIDGTGWRSGDLEVPPGTLGTIGERDIREEYRIRWDDGTSRCGIPYRSASSLATEDQIREYCEVLEEIR